MDMRDVSRRDLLLHGGAAVAGLAFLRFPEVALAFHTQPGEEVVPWLDQPAANPVPDIGIGGWDSSAPRNSGLQRPS